MKNFNKKQRFILCILITAVVGIICYYVYAKDENERTVSNSNLEIQNTENIKEEENNEFILVHVSGAVNKEGVVKLKTNSRISDAIDKARWSKTRCIYEGY